MAGTVRKIRNVDIVDAIERLPPATSITLVARGELESSSTRKAEAGVDANVPIELPAELGLALAFLAQSVASGQFLLIMQSGSETRKDPET